MAMVPYFLECKTPIIIGGVPFQKGDKIRVHAKYGNDWQLSLNGDLSWHSFNLLNFNAQFKKIM